MEQYDFEDEGSRMMDAFNAAAGACARRARILERLALAPGASVLDVGSGPGHQALAIAEVVGPDGRVEGVDLADTAIRLARHRCATHPNVSFENAGATQLPHEAGVFDAAMSSQTLAYVDDVPAALAELFRVVKPGGRVLVHDTDWGAMLWHSSDPERMARILAVLVGAFADPHLPQTLGQRLAAAGFVDIQAEPFIQLELDFDPTGVSANLLQSIAGYVGANGIPSAEVEAWQNDLREQAAKGAYFFSSNEYIFTAVKP